MAAIKKEDIVGVYIKDAQNMSPGHLHCLDCYSGDFTDLTLDDILTQDESEDGETLYFCDSCKKAI